MWRNLGAEEKEKYKELFQEYNNKCRRQLELANDDR